MSDIIPPTPPDNKKIFRELCHARALRFAASDLELQEAVDWLADWAMRKGLACDHGQDWVQAVMAEEFAKVREDL
jgi:hypothetical protein